MSSLNGTARNGSVELHWTLDQPASIAPSHRLLLINGLGSPLVAFEPQFVAAFVERGCAVARFDNRDIGRSSRITERPDPASSRTRDRAGSAPPSSPPYALPYTLSDMALDAVAVLDGLGWSTAHVLGQSMGGMIAQQMAISHPERLQSLIALMTASGERGFGAPTPEAMEALLQPAPAERQAWLDHRLATERIWASPAHWSEEWVVAKGQAMLDHGIDQKGTFRQFRAVMAGGSRDSQLANLTVPTLVVHGSADTLIGPDGGRHLAEVIPGARYVEIEGLGHDLAPPLVPALVDVVVDFLRG